MDSLDNSEVSYQYLWAHIGSFSVEFLKSNGDKILSKFELTRAFIKDFDLIAASKRTGEEKLQFVEMENSLNNLRLNEFAQTSSKKNEEDAPPTKSPIDKKLEKKKHRHRKSHRSSVKNHQIEANFNDYWIKRRIWFTLSTWLADFGKEMEENQRKQLEEQILNEKPTFLIKSHEDLTAPRFLNITKEIQTKPNITYEELFEKHCELIEQQIRLDYEEERKNQLIKQAEMFISQIEKLGFTPGIEKDSIPSINQSEEAGKTEGTLVFKNIECQFDERFFKAKYCIPNPIVMETEEIEKKAKNDEENKKKEVNFEFDEEKDQYLIASKAGDLYKNDKEICKYYYQRYRLFSKLDEGIIMDKEGWFSVTPERIAEHIADRVVRNGVTIVVDAFTGVGGNAIQFALRGAYVIAIDLDPVRLKCARHNARVYGVDQYISFICADYFHVAATWTNSNGDQRRPNVDAVFLSPPWGGPSYLNNADFDLATGCCPNGIKIFEASLKLSKNIAYYLPRNCKVKQLIELAQKIDGKCEIEQSAVNSKLKTITAYYGDLKFSK